MRASRMRLRLFPRRPRKELPPATRLDPPAVFGAHEAIVILADHPREGAARLVVHENRQERHSLGLVLIDDGEAHVARGVADALVGMVLLELPAPGPDCLAALQIVWPHHENTIIGEQLVQCVRSAFVDSPRGLRDETFQLHVVRVADQQLAAWDRKFGSHSSPHHVCAPARTGISLTAIRRSRATMYATASAMSSGSSFSTPAVCFATASRMPQRMCVQLGLDDARLDEADANAPGLHLLAQRLADRAGLVGRI